MKVLIALIRVQMNTQVRAKRKCLPGMLHLLSELFYISTIAFLSSASCQEAADKLAHIHSARFCFCIDETTRSNTDADRG